MFALVSVWIYNINPSTVNENSLIQISGTLKTIPHYESGVKGSATAKFELNEFESIIFSIPSGYYEHLDKSIFDDAIVNDSITFHIKKRVYNNRLKNNSEYSFFRDFLDGQHIRFYDLYYNEKNYLHLDFINEKIIENNYLKHIFFGFLFILICIYINMNLKK
jgi:hypothetical protein